MKIALVHDYLVQYGGAERVLEVFSEIFPHAPIYTLVYDKNLFKDRFCRKKIYTSFLQSLPLSKSHHRSFPILMPAAIESFDFSSYDIVLSDSNSYAKGIISSSQTLHICYCHTPMRYAWDDYYSYTENFSVAKLIRKAIPLAMNYIRLWDKISADRVDKFITNSNFVARRIAKYYRRSAEVIYPPVSLSFFNPDKKIKKEDYFLIVGRLIPYKRFDLVIGAFNTLDMRLKIIGDGPEAQRLKKMAKPNIEFLGWRTDEEIRGYYAKAKAFLFPQEEDFGIVALESLASGTPVIAYRGGGALEIIKEGINGIFFDTQTVDVIVDAVRDFGDKKFDSEKIKNSVISFDKEIFKKKIKDFVEREWKEFNKNK